MTGFDAKQKTPHHGAAGPPGVTDAKLEALRAELKEDVARLVAEVVRDENEALLRRHQAMKPLLSVEDVAKTLDVSKRTVETIIAEGKLRPLWIRGQRRFHPDTIEAYLRS